MPDRTIETLASLAEPLRMRLYQVVARSAGPVDRDTAAAAANISRALAAFHLDRLADAGLLEVEYHRRTGRTGPGAGRPAKFYRRATDRAIDVSLPPRRYELAAEVFAAAVDASPSAQTAALRSAQERGAAMGRDFAADQAPEPGAALERAGYEPTVEEDGTVRLRNCPFDRLTRDHRALTCSVNLALLGAATAAANWDYEARLAPRADSCCVALVPR